MRCIYFGLTPMVKAIIFDLGGVLFTNGTAAFVKKIMTRYGQDETTVRDVLDGKLGSLYREAKISRDEFWREAKEALGLHEDTKELESEWIVSYELIEGTKKIIKALAKTYKVYFLSDNVRERVEQLEQKYHFLSLFSGGIFSHEVGIRKPDPRIYQMILDRARADPSEAIYIDDKPDFLSPAQALGIATFVFTSPEQLREDLKMCGIISVN